MKISGNTIFIPGATSGIGLALALALRDKGNKVIVGGRRQELLDQIVAEHPDVDAVRIDTADPDRITAVAAQVLTAHPDLNVLITMAGVMSIEDWHHPETFLASAESTITTNVLGPIRLIAAFIEHLQNQPAATVMTVSSGLGFTPLRVTPSYNASKAAIHLLTETLRLQFAGSSVEFKELVPPAVKTDLVPGQRDSEWAMPLEDFVREVVDILQNQPEATEIQVENVKFLRYAEVRGEYEHAIAVLNSADPHAS
ncbi:SDR family NAD(P)-dependent oxidoreductase [Mycolicibacterium fluoranthenivorans]|jgi:short-subunit dehydrogenase involved in D-alanine esterification of teichoic acids|uniref:SDR family NAD(P)-dependent oxidoreductase n=1 Tax=Mycolicibacterium fluoranthenivorans TaxID=258505 RepID=A0A7G8PJ95_9MYCO|nr:MULTISPECIES: SDR family NAD(P)-dependent oxidoreductase [Mycobacteriaceae]MCV7252496.1 SDR family NAD(P)-dependent oxidoreductase [Mycobacterium hackensackense]QNJ94411.1 SDR family NAD(P)-dependent oxidoreductase [Mycolicibacterium fluoranthenivorans]